MEGTGSVREGRRTCTYLGLGEDLSARFVLISLSFLFTFLCALPHVLARKKPSGNLTPQYPDPIKLIELSGKQSIGLHQIGVDLFTARVKSRNPRVFPLCSYSPWKNNNIRMSQWNSDLFFPSGGQILYSCFCPQCSTASARNALDTSNWFFNCLCVSGPVAYNVTREGYGIEVPFIPLLLALTNLSVHNINNKK